VGVRTENRDVALLEKKPERDGAQQLDETAAAPGAIGESRREHKEDQHHDLDHSKKDARHGAGALGPSRRFGGFKLLENGSQQRTERRLLLRLQGLPQKLGVARD